MVTGAAAEPVKVKAKVERPCRGMERWQTWARMLQDGVYSSRAELARGEGVSRAAVTMGLKKLELGRGSHAEPVSAVGIDLHAE